MNSKNTHALTPTFTENKSTTEIQPHTECNYVICGTEHPSTAQITNYYQENIACYSSAI
jgi:hypothetical protein